MIYILIGYLVYLLIVFFVYCIKTNSMDKELVGFLVGLVVFILLTPIMLVLMPFMGTYWCLRWIDSEDIEKFTIHKLTEGNKITLRHLGFDEGEFISKANYDYNGFRWNKGAITISYNGRVTIWGRQSPKIKLLIEQIKNLPTEVTTTVASEVENG